MHHRSRCQGELPPECRLNQIMRDYEDKDGSKAKAQLEKAEKKQKTERDSDATHAEEDEGDDDDDKDDKGPSICSVDQSAITGESLAVDKYVGDIAYYTCGVKRGKCYAVLTTSAKGSFVGKTASLVSSESCDVAELIQIPTRGAISRSSSAASDRRESAFWYPSPEAS